MGVSATAKLVFGFSSANCDWLSAFLGPDPYVDDIYLDAIGFDLVNPHLELADKRESWFRVPYGQDGRRTWQERETPEYKAWLKENFLAISNYKTKRDEALTRCPFDISCIGYVGDYDWVLGPKEGTWRSDYLEGIDVTTISDNIENLTADTYAIIKLLGLKAPKDAKPELYLTYFMG